MANSLPFQSIGYSIKFPATTATTLVLALNGGSTTTTYNTIITAPQIQVTNMSTVNWAHVNFSSSSGVNSSWPSSTGPTLGYFVPPQSQRVFSPPGGSNNYASVSLSAGTGNVYLTPGVGY